MNINTNLLNSAFLCVFDFAFHVQVQQCRHWGWLLSVKGTANTFIPIFINLFMFENDRESLENRQ